MASTATPNLGLPQWTAGEALPGHIMNDFNAALLAIDGLAGTGRTTQTVKANADAIALKAAIAQPSKINASLSNGWTGTGWYFKDTLGFVHVYVYVEGGTTGWTIFNLPAGYRPAVNYLMVGINTVTKAAILGFIETTGNLEGDNPTAGCLYAPAPYLPA